MIRIYSPKDEVELSMIKGLLDGEEILYFVHNDYFGSIRFGPLMELYNKRTIMVAPQHAEQAKEVIYDLVQSLGPFSDYSMADRIRMILEFLLFGWIIPGNRWRKNRLEE
ncbi:MAG: DUF2007 domain-containing protein [Candidatus Omnitrophica bacterium]|nr:DUF2007 domain-containing protein [Candidatus Omnitrophota bacterium]